MLSPPNLVCKLSQIAPFLKCVMHTVWCAQHTKKWVEYTSECASHTLILSHHVYTWCDKIKVCEAHSEVCSTHFFVCCAHQMVCMTHFNNLHTKLGGLSTHFNRVVYYNDEPSKAFLSSNLHATPTTSIILCFAYLI